MGLGTVLALAWSLAQPVTYTASAQVLVPTGVGGADVATQRVATHAVLATSPEVLVPAAAGLNAGLGPASVLRTSPDQLARRVRAQPVPGTALIEISAVGETAARARDVAAAVAVQLLARTRALDPTGTEPVLARAATEPDAADGPATALDSVAGGVAGAVLGVGAGLALTLRRRRHRGHTVITRSEATAAGGVPVLATLARERSGAPSPAWFGGRAEAIRQLRTAVRLVDHDVRTLVVTSPNGGEGRTGVAVDLALALADAGEDVVLVDADLRHPAVATRLGLDGSVGLTSVLLGTATVVEALQPWRSQAPHPWRSETQLQVLTTGPAVPHPSELLGSTRMLELLTSLREAGWTVVLDAPPVLPVTDAVLLSRLTDGTVLTVRSGLTHKAELADAVATLTAVGAPLLGTVLTGAPAPDDRYLRQVRHEAGRRHAAPQQVGPRPDEPDHRVTPPVISAATPVHGVTVPGWSPQPLLPPQPAPEPQPLSPSQPPPAPGPIPQQQDAQPHSRREARRLAQLYPEPRPGVRPPPPPHTVTGSPLAPPNQLPAP